MSNVVADNTTDQSDSDSDLHPTDHDGTLEESVTLSDIQFTINKSNNIITFDFHNGSTYTLNISDDEHHKLVHYINDNRLSDDPGGILANNKKTVSDSGNNKSHTIVVADNKDIDQPKINHFTHYFRKYAGNKNAARPGYISIEDGVWAFIASFIGIAILALINFNLFIIDLNEPHDTILIGSFGASCVLLYSAIQSDFSQPRNVFGGHVLSAIVGVIFQQMPRGDNDSLIFVQAALSVSCAITVMNLTKTLHPPAGATALIAILPSNTVQSINWLYIGLPVASGAAILILVALIINNIAPHRRYPKYWI